MGIFNTLNSVVFAAVVVASVGANADAAVIPVADPYFDMFPAGQTAATYLTLNGVGCPSGSGCKFSDSATVGWTQSVTMVTRTANAGQFQIGQIPASIAFNSFPMINGTTPEPIVLRAANATANQIVSTPIIKDATYTLDVDLGFEKFDFDEASVFLIVDGHQVMATPLVNLTQDQMQKTGNWYDFQASYTAANADDDGSIEILLSSLTNGKGFGFFGNVRLTDSVPVSTSPAAPEPATWAMMLIGFAGLSLMGYRASRNSAPAV